MRDLRYNASKANLLTLMPHPDTSAAVTLRARVNLRPRLRFDSGAGSQNTN